MDLTVFVVDDNLAACEALTFLLRQDGLTCRGYTSAAAFLAQLRPEHRGCIITDLRMPEMSGIALAERLQEGGCRIPVIIMTGYADVPLAVQAMKVGVQDFIEKPFKSDTVRRAVRQCLDLTCANKMEDARRAAIEHRLSSLTKREKEILGGVVEGRSNKELGLKLDISPRTVEIHRANVMSKMQADGLADLVRIMSIRDMTQKATADWAEPLMDYTPLDAFGEGGFTTLCATTLVHGIELLNEIQHEPKGT